MNNDATGFFSDFAVSVTIGGVACKGIFDDNYGEAFGIVAGSGPSLIVEASVVADQDTAVVMGTRNFVVKAVEPDGAGFQRLKLEAQ